MTAVLQPQVEAAVQRLRRHIGLGTTKVVITGGPRTGKSTIAETISALFGGKILHTDDLIKTHDWSAASEEVARWFTLTRGPWICEGVTAVRGLRKWLETNRTGRPCELVIWMGTSVVALTPGQETMAEGCATIWNGAPGKPGVVAGLTTRGVLIDTN